MLIIISSVSNKQFVFLSSNKIMYEKQMQTLQEMKFHAINSLFQFVKIAALLWDRQSGNIVRDMPFVADHIQKQLKLMRPHQLS